ncbi:16S rRNA (adenine1518-N6/adenine1519-N6)-dimethyltransferase [Faunimonas pinastri]|uniref:Ribosomal RNA small subunit methyltransferase A n=1 Tax=Faunimonas pinastri TaxID=1855383 RepID=A0A1H9D227_9HYPH|nr:16S rRNA (adenine(1518)-N(6)/adenine(1519)-N(6))-dimethyltransferase RsmA [Faunimonas pinastri]SEQ06883.1 16S rRNA (adenine1518-N6/adenine1519-N6)-dimethyltransferase [Faunimonas pinastri]
MDALEKLPPLREVIAAHDLSARKALGQNFLLDINLTRRIARSGGPLSGAHVIEVGPGPGGLTRALLLEGASHVTAIERDARALPALAEISQAAPGRLTAIEGDALATDYAALAADKRVRIVANLPYNIATPLLTGWITSSSWPSWWDSLTLMFQLEVAERIVATPGSKNYGRLAILAQWRTRPHLLFEVPARAFTPPPKVTSAIVRLEPRTDAVALVPRSLETVTAAAFGQRRKMLRSSLRSLWNEPEPVLERAGIDPQMRAEQVPVEGFLTLAGIWEEQLGKRA